MKAAVGLLCGVLMTASLGPSPCVGADHPSATCRDCNVILITVDSLRGDELKVGGSPSSRMPHFDQAAARALAFPDAFSPSPDSTPSNVSIISGIQPWHQDAMLTDEPYPQMIDNDHTLTSILRGHGYDIDWMYLEPSGVFDQLPEKELHVGSLVRIEDLKRGSKFFLWVKAAIHDPYDPKYEDVSSVDPGVPQKDYPTPLDVSRCMIASLAAKAAPEAPLSSTLSPITQGWRETGPRSFHEDLDHFIGLTDPKARLDAIHGFPVERRMRAISTLCFWSFFSSDTVRTARVLYDARAMEIDAAFGRLMRNLGSRGLLENSLVVIASQHGEEFLEHGHVAHSQQLYEESLHVPLLFLIPGMSGERVAGGLAQITDIMPTILGYLGLQIPAGLDGISLLPCLTGRCGRPYVLAAWQGQSLRDERYTYLRSPGPGRAGPVEGLFDRRTDAREARDIARSRPEVVNRLRALLLENIGNPDEAMRSGPPWLNRKIRRRSQRDGYW